MTRTATVLVDRWSARRNAGLDAAWIVGFSLLTGLLAHVRIPLPFTPVPVTGQTAGVLLAGAALGSKRGFLSQALYLAEGALGLPVFAAGLAGPTAGYLWAFPIAAALLGWIVERGVAGSALRLAGALLLSDSLVLALGTVWLRFYSAITFHQAWLLGFAPFLAGETLKLAVLAATLPAIIQRGRA